MEITAKGDGPMNLEANQIVEGHEQIEIEDNFETAFWILMGFSGFSGFMWGGLAVGAFGLWPGLLAVASTIATIGLVRRALCL